MVLTRDGITVKNPLVYAGFATCFEWGYETVTDFYFTFETPNNQPGIYGLTGKYYGETFSVYNKIIEAYPLGVEAANREALYAVDWCYRLDSAGDPYQISEISFSFSGVQQAFYLSDLTDMKLTLNGEEIAFSVRKDIFRYLETTGGVPETWFNLVFETAHTAPGTYVLTGSYQGKNFTSRAITIP